VAVGAHERVGIGDLDGALLFLDLRGPYRLGEIFEIDLMADASAGRHDAEIRERLLAPAQERIALAVALIFDLDVFFQRGGRAEMVHHHRMIDDEVDRGERIDFRGRATEFGHRIAHRGEIDNAGNAGEILHQHAGRAERDFAIALLLLHPRGERLDVGRRDRTAILVAQEILEQHLQGIGQARNVAISGLLDRFEAVVVINLLANRQFAARFQAVLTQSAHGDKTPMVRSGFLVQAFWAASCGPTAMAEESNGIVAELCAAVY